MQAHFIIIRILCIRPYYLKAGIWKNLLYQKKGSQHGNNVLNRHHPHYPSNNQRAIMVCKLRYMGKSFHTDAIRHNTDLIRMTAQLLLNNSIALKQGYHHISSCIGQLSNIIKILYPDRFKIPLGPATFDNFCFSFPGINTMLRNQEGLVIHFGCNTANNTTVSRCHGMIQISLW